MTLEAWNRSRPFASANSHRGGEFRSGDVHFLRPSHLVLVVVVLLLAFVWRIARAQVAPVTVTFDVTLPADTPPQDTIYVAGNFQNWDPGATPLTRDSATHAHGSITTTDGYAMEFKFTRGDWARGEKALDCSELPNRTATASANKTISATVANWADRCVAVYDTRAQKVQIQSQVLGVMKEFYIYTPPGYAESPGRRYPVLYLFRGHESEWFNKHQDETRNGRNVIDVFEDLLAAGTVGPMIIVSPGSSSDDNAVSGMVTNFKSPQLTNATGIGTGRFEDYLLSEVIPYVDANYRTVGSREGRGVDGFSLGGFMSVKIAAKYPQLFRTVGAFDGTHFYADLTCQNVDIVRDANTFNNSMFDPVFGFPRDTAYVAQNNGPNLVCNSTPAAMQSLAWFIQYGPLTSEPNDANYLRGEHLMEKLSAKGVTNGITNVLPGGHHWSTADEHMRQTLPLHWNVLGLSTVIGAVPLLSVASVKTHGNAGTFAIPLPLTGPPEIECRASNGQETIVFSFANPLTKVAGAAVSKGAVTSSAIASNPHQFVVELSNIANAQTITLTLSDVQDSFGNRTPTLSVPLALLAGDVNGDGAVNSADATATRNRSGEQTNATNFRADLNGDGSINSADATIARNNSGHAMTAQRAAR